ncbi:MAG: inositol monophosphatase family protein, partial [Gemmatimonadota bacterium]|nr:inositol monophosphatase family protein [Gemmatimonadota bacterium]
MNNTLGSSEIHELLDFAVELAQDAGALTLEYFGGIVDADAKGDGSPVTVADRNAEKLIRQKIEERFPSDSILG